MAYETNKKAAVILSYPLPVAFSILTIGLLGGYIAHSFFGNFFFERFGALTAGLGVLVFGIVAAELLTRAQISFNMGDDGEPPHPFKTKSVRFALDCQAFVVFAGTLQWGFGGLIIGD
ncbi:hypothetical protein OO012_14665 [Rhodobacteraceae bacterium KMM 6894]|nr:hypothetical protein [Rhodobacteraceae bacterium KMM 6894]